jgi:hypothetical protein
VLRVFLAVLLAVSSTFAQDITVSGTIRTRLEAWDWFDTSAEDEYVFSGTLARVAIGQQGKAFDWQAELALPILLGLPENAVAPGVQGQSGLGATYYVANKRNQHAALPLLKQAFVRVKGGTHALRFGRFEFIDGSEVAPKNATLAAVKRDRIAHRLLGNFGWSHVGRSFDGAQYTYTSGGNNVTLLGARPTRGVFQVDGWGELDITVAYAALTKQVPRGKSSGEGRVFFLHYYDWRDVLKTDSRPAAFRRSDLENISIPTFGGHYAHVWETNGGTFDALVWGALQAGKWGLQNHRAGAITIEGGWQPQVQKARPWLRAGLHYGSGDDEALDDTHGTFFQMLPTPRWYARFPFYNQMNSQDAYVQAILRPHARLTLRSEFHHLRLANENDLWYQGGGAFQPWTFGYVGRQAGTNDGTDFASLADISVDYQIDQHWSIGGYFAAAWGGSYIRSIYPAGDSARLGYVELGLRF